MPNYKRPYNYNELKNRCYAIARMRNNHARQLCKEAGLDPALLGIHPHNAMVSFSYGKPWPNVNYSKVRACLRELDRQWEAGRILDKLYKRLGPKGFTFGHYGEAK